MDIYEAAYEARELNEENRAIDADYATESFTGPHTHTEWTGKKIMVWDSWVQMEVERFEKILVPCAGCWL